MERKRKVGITLCAVSLGIEVLMGNFILIGLLIAMIVIQCKMSSPYTQLILSIISLVAAVLQFLIPIIVILLMVFTEPTHDSAGAGYDVVLMILIPVIILCIVVMVLLSVNVKMAHDMNRKGSSHPVQQVVYVTAQDGTQQAMVVQQMK